MWFLLLRTAGLAYAEQTLFPPWWEYFDTFRLISGASDGCSMTFRQLVTSTQLNEIHHHDSYYVLNFFPHSAYAAFDCHRLRRFHGEVAYILLWRPEFQEFYSLFSVEKLWECELGIAVAVFVNNNNNNNNNNN